MAYQVTAYHLSYSGHPSYETELISLHEQSGAKGDPQFIKLQCLKGFWLSDHTHNFTV